MKKTLLCDEITLTIMMHYNLIPISLAYAKHCALIGGCTKLEKIHNKFSFYWKHFIVAELQWIYKQYILKP